MKNIILIILLNVISFNGLAGGTTQLPVTAIIPAYNTSISTNSMIYGTEVLIGYDRARFPCFEALPNFEGDTEYIEIDANNNMEITVSGLGSAPCLNLSTSYLQFQKYSLGVLPIGQYTIQMYLADDSTPLPVPPDMNRILYGLLIEFEVVAPVVVPLFNGYMIVALVLMIVLLSWFYFRKSAKLIVLSMLTSLLLTTSLSAKTYLIQLSSDVSAPTPDEVMGQANISPAPPVWLLNAISSSFIKTISSSQVMEIRKKIG